MDYHWPVSPSEAFSLIINVRDLGTLVKFNLEFNGLLIRASVSADL